MCFLPTSLEKSLGNCHLTNRERGIYLPDDMVFILYGMVLLLTLPLQDMIVRARDLGYSVAGVPISPADRIPGDSKPSGDEIVEYAKGVFNL